MIKLEHLTRAYRNGLKRTFVLRDVNLDIQEGEFITIQGPSGAGKSTLLHILGMLDAPSDGEYHFDGDPVHELSEKRRTNLHREEIGFVFQAYHLIDDLNVYENIETPLLYNKVSSSKRKSRVADLLDRFGIVAKKKLFPSQLSGGQQQLVGVARALVHEPRLILADEPTGNLHSEKSEQIMERFRELNERDGVTIIQATHSEKQAAYGDRVVYLEDGRVKDDYSISDEE
jgi:ABC-type lipoprotein export system ATPase subunit